MQYLINLLLNKDIAWNLSLADLMDNSITQSKIEVLVIMNQPFTMFIADNGNGMDEETLKASMQFPSNSPEEERNIFDLGRFGLGMKRASFSQTRCFTVISKKKESKTYCGRTWDVNYLIPQCARLSIQKMK